MIQSQWLTAHWREILLMNKTLKFSLYLGTELSYDKRRIEIQGWSQMDYFHDTLMMF